MAYVPMRLGDLTMSKPQQVNIPGRMLGAQKGFAEMQKNQAQQKVLSGMEDPRKRYDFLAGVQDKQRGMTKGQQMKWDALQNSSTLKAQINAIAAKAVQEHKTNGESEALTGMLEQMDSLKGQLAQFTEKHYRDPFEEYINSSREGSRLGEQIKAGEFGREKGMTDIVRKAVKDTKEMHSTIGNYFVKGHDSFGKIDDLLKEAVAGEGNAQSMQGAIKSIVSAIDNSVVTSGEMDNLSSPGIVNRVKTWLSQEGDGLFYTEKDTNNFISMYEAMRDSFIADVDIFRDTLLSTLKAQFGLISNALFKNISEDQKKSGRTIITNYANQYLPNVDRVKGEDGKASRLPRLGKDKQIYAGEQTGAAAAPTRVSTPGKVAKKTSTWGSAGDLGL